MTTTLEPPVTPPGTSSGTSRGIPPIVTDNDAASTGDARASELGLGSSTALVMGSIIGTGVFTMPAVMAGAGTSSIITLAVIALGAVLLATSRAT